MTSQDILYIIIKDLKIIIEYILLLQTTFSVQTCLKTDTLDFVMEKIVLSEVFICHLF